MICPLLCYHTLPLIPLIALLCFCKENCCRVKYNIKYFGINMNTDMLDIATNVQIYTQRSESLGGSQNIV